MSNTKSDDNKKASFLNLGLEKTKSELINELLIPILLFSTFGAFYWAIRGSSGYGGSSGGAYVGIGWGIIWLFLSYERSEKKKRPYSSGWMVLAITLGIAYGGMHGYGQFMSWIQGIFRVDPQNGITVPINPIIGFAWLFQCGLAWGGAAGIMMAWCGSKKSPTRKDWIIRLSFGIGGGLIAYLITLFNPGLVNPLYDVVDYTDLATCIDCERTLSTSLSSMFYLGIFLGFLLYEIMKKDWRNVMLALTMGIGFALAFSIFAFWHFGYSLTGISIDWWKFWEMSIGFFGGMTIAICYYLYNRSFDDSQIESVRKQPFSSKRNAEKLLGIEAAIAVAIGWSVYNGMGGFFSNFKLDESLALIVSIPLVVLCLAYFILSLRNIRRAPFNTNDGRVIIDNPTQRFLIINSTLVILGFMVSLNATMSSASWLLIIIYTILLAVGAVSFIIRVKK